MADSPMAYREISPGVSAPMVSGPGGPVRQDVQAAGAVWQSIGSMAESGTKYIDALQKATDLNTVALKRGEYGKRVGEALASFSNSVDGSNPTQDMQKWGEIHERIKYDVTKDVSGSAAPALQRYFSEHEETFNGKVRESVYKAVQGRAKLTRESSLGDKLALGMQTTDNTEREQYLLQQYNLIDAQVAAGLLSPIDAEVAKVNDRQLYYSDLFRGDLLKPDWKKTYDEFTNNKPIDSLGHTWAQLGGKENFSALERMTQTIFAERTREAVRISEKREAEGKTLANRDLQEQTARLARTATPEQWEAHRQKVLASPFATPETIKAVESRPDPLDATPQTKAAKTLVQGAYTEMTRKFDSQFKVKEQEDLLDLQRRVQAGEDPLKAAEEVRRSRTSKTNAPRGFSGEANQQSLANYEQMVLSRVAKGDIKQAQADQLIANARQWVANQQKR